MVHRGPESPVEILLRVFFIKTSSRRKSSERGRETVREMKRMFCFLATHEWSKNDDRLLQAVEHGDTDKVSSLLGKKGISPTKLDNEGKSALHLAATKGQLECLGAMLAHGVDVMVPDVSGLNVLHLASKNSHQECVKKILQSKCPVECADTNGRTAVHHAASGGSVSIVQLLCEQKCPINTKDVEGFTPLIQAAQSNHAEVCRYLIDQGADIDARDKNGRTALMLACEHGSGNAVEILVKRGADLKVVDALGHDALHYYKLSGNADILSFLQAVPKGHSEDTKSAQTPKQLDPSIRFSGDRSETPKKRKAPPPPVSSMQSPLPTDTSTPQTFNPLPASKCEASEVEKVSAQGKEASNEEMRKLQEEKVKLLEMIQNLNQQLLDKKHLEMEELKRKLDEVLEDRERAECMVSDLEEKLEEMEKVLARSISEDEFEEFKQSQSSLLDEVNQEKVLLIEKLREAQGEIKKLQERLSHQGLSQEKQNFLEMQKALNRTIDKLNRQVAELTQWYNEAQSELKEVKGKQLQAVSEHINSSYVPKDQHKQAVRLLNDSIGELKDYLSEAEAKLADAERDTAKLQKDLEVQRQSSVCLAEHTQIVASLENIIKAAESKASQAVQELERKEHDLQILQQVTAENSAIIQEEMIPKSEYEKLKASFRAELNRLTVKTGEVLKEQERASAEITQARKECSLSKSEREVAQAQLVLREQELTDLRAKCREMQDNVSELEKRVGSSLKQEEDKEKKINELYKEVTKLKEALNSLSQLSYTSNIPKRQNQQLETLQQQTKNLQHQLTEANQRHQEVVSVYRMHLLYAVQGQMDEDVQKALKQILTMCKTHTLKK
eukprot:gi/632969845/ref/XP_007901308.1/ PREDICTED: ankycorbin isoform X5 [Callorhinchus milii]